MYVEELLLEVSGSADFEFFEAFEQGRVVGEVLGE